MKQFAIAATATLAIVTIAGLTGTSAAQAQITKVVQTVEHPASLRAAFSVDPSALSRICMGRPGALDVLIDANGRPVNAAAVIRADDC